MNLVNFYEMLFDPDEYTTVGNMFENKVCLVHGEHRAGEFFCINPLDGARDHGFFVNEKYSEEIPRRADLNVIKYRNFLFEIDCLSLEDQLKLFSASGIPFTTLVYSGGKSYHAILSLAEPLDLEPHLPESVAAYKHVWKRLAAKIDLAGRKLGFEYSVGESSFVDPACKNPSRFSRRPGEQGEGRKLQELLFIKNRISADNFVSLLSSCPEVFEAKKVEFAKPVQEIYTVDQLRAALPVGLRRFFEDVEWAAPAGLYSLIYKNVLWAIDETGVSKELLSNYLEKYTFPILVASGYPAHKIMVPVEHAYGYKRRA